MTHVPRRLGWLFLALYALFGATSGRGFVLCFEPDGHVSLEAGVDCSSCCSSEVTDSGALPPSVDACPCSDFSISVAESVRVRFAGQQLDVPTRASLGSSALPVPATLASVPMRPRELLRSHASVALGALRTVLLLV